MAQRYHFALAGGIVAAVVLLTAYVSVRVSTTFASTHSLGEGLFASALLAAELFVAVQALGYFTSVLQPLRATDSGPARLVAPYTATPVAVVVSSFNEAEELLEETLAAVRALDYPTVNLYVVDDSTHPANRHAAAVLAGRYGGRLVQRQHRAGYKAGAINDLIPALTEPYMALLDADQRPAHSWLREVVPLLEAHPRLAFVQAPQVYVDTEGLPVAQAAAYQQAVFYEYICEAKSVSNAMFCCGSNVVLRREALLSIAVEAGGRRHFLDETSVTEDFATSFRLHTGGWQSCYVNRTYVVGLAPETLAAYFTQQARWAMGTIAMCLRILGHLARHPMSLRPSQWWEYLLSGMYYFVGSVNMIFMSASIAFLLFGIMPIRMAASVYLMLFVPYFLCMTGIFFGTMKVRGYSFRGTWLGMALTFGTFWIFMKAASVAVLGLKRPFRVTPKAVGTAVPLRTLAPQLVMLLLCCAAVAAGVRGMLETGPDTARLVTTSWASYHALLLATLFLYFNRPVTIRPRRAIVARWSAS